MIRECGSFWQRLFPFIPGQVNGTGEDEVMEWGGGVVVVVVVVVCVCVCVCVCVGGFESWQHHRIG